MGRNLIQGTIFIENKANIFVKVDHSAQYFEINIPTKLLTYVICDNNVLEDQSLIIYSLKPEKVYLLLGLYKELEEQKQLFRDKMIEYKMNLDDNWLIIQEI